jgi:hypothetical protein
VAHAGVEQGEPRLQLLLLLVGSHGVKYSKINQCMESTLAIPNSNRTRSTPLCISAVISTGIQSKNHKPRNMAMAVHFSVTSYRLPSLQPRVVPPVASQQSIRTASTRLRGLGFWSCLHSKRHALSSVTSSRHCWWSHPPFQPLAPRCRYLSGLYYKSQLCTTCNLHHGWSSTVASSEPR